jgi:hypothetical protein
MFWGEKQEDLTIGRFNDWEIGRIGRFIEVILNFKF